MGLDQKLYLVSKKELELLDRVKKLQEFDKDEKDYILSNMIEGIVNINEIRDWGKYPNFSGLIHRDSNTNLEEIIECELDRNLYLVSEEELDANQELRSFINQSLTLDWNSPVKDEIEILYEWS